MAIRTAAWRRPAPTPGPEVDTPQALRDWNEDVAIGQTLEDLRRPSAAELAQDDRS